MNQICNKSQLYSSPKGDRAARFDQGGAIHHQHRGKLQWKANAIHTCPIPFLLHCNSPEGKSILPSCQGCTVESVARGSWWELAAPGYFLVSALLLHCVRGGRSSLLPSVWFRRVLILGFIAWEIKNPVGTVGPWSELVPAHSRQWVMISGL